METSPENMPKLPRYRCHKIVRAAKITRVSYGNGGTLLTVAVPRPGGRQESAELAVSTEWSQKHNPDVGGYVVVYADGYTSFSPAEAFEAGYTLLEEPDHADQ